MISNFRCRVSAILILVFYFNKSVDFKLKLNFVRNVSGVEGHCDEDHVYGHQAEVVRLGVGHPQRRLLHRARKLVRRF